MQHQTNAWNLPISDNVAVKDDVEDWISYKELVLRIEAFKSYLKPGPKRLMFLYADNSISTIVAYIGALQANYVVAFLDPKLPEQTQAKLVELYQPEISAHALVDKSAANELPGYEVVQHSTQEHGPIYPSTATLLSTSGSTGTPKFVRLSSENILSNAANIAKVLSITEDDRALAHLPIHYSYGLSVVTSHLMAGAALSMTNHTFMERPFWPKIKQDKITNLSGVPWHYETMKRMGVKRLGLENIKHMTQAGGRLGEPIQAEFQAYMESINGAFHVMYGQTEAAPRITTRSHADGLKSLKTVGCALPEGEINIVDIDDISVEIGTVGQVVYKGPNVMLGYAQSRNDLALPDTMQGTLYTGDLGYLTADQQLVITGRADRMIKVAGLRANMDEMQKALESSLPTLIIYFENKIYVHVVSNGSEDEQRQDILALLKSHFTIPMTAYKVMIVEKFPITSRGKLDYKAAMQALKTQKSS